MISVKVRNEYIGGPEVLTFDGTGRGIQNEVKDVTAKALNMTAYQVQKALKAKMKSIFDRPKPYTLNAPYVWRATPDKLTSYVKLREEGGKGQVGSYLWPQVYGGNRREKEFEGYLHRRHILPDGAYAVPGAAAPLDAYGNIAPGQIVKILSYFKTFSEVGHFANITEKRKKSMHKGTKKRQGVSYFAIPFRPYHDGLKQPGIYRRTSYDTGRRSTQAGGIVQPMLAFVKKPQYRAILPWYQIAQEVLRANWRSNFARARNEFFQTQ